MTIKQLFDIIATAASTLESPEDIGDTTLLIQTPDDCWLELNTLQFAEDAKGRECLVLGFMPESVDEPMN